MRANDARWSGVRSGRAAWLLVLLATSACTTAGPTRYQALRDDWQRSERASRPSRTDEDLFPDARFLERPALVEQVLDRNPSVRAAQTR